MPSNICTDASGLSLMASIKIEGRNFDNTIFTLGPISLSAIILANSSAVLMRTAGFIELQNKSSRYIRAPKKYISVNG